MYASINLDFFDENREKGVNEYIGDDKAAFKNLTTETHELKIEEDKISITVTNNLGYFSIEIPLKLEDYIDLLSNNIKKMNKIKTMLETLK